MVEVKEELERFKYNCLKLMECEEKLKELDNELHGLSAKPNKTGEEAKYKNSPTIYKNSIIQKMDEEEQLKIDRDYYLIHVRKVGNWLQNLDPDDVEILQDKFVTGLTLVQISKKHMYGNGSMYRKIEGIIHKIQKNA